MLCVVHVFFIYPSFYVSCHSFIHLFIHPPTHHYPSINTNLLTHSSIHPSIRLSPHPTHCYLNAYYSSTQLCILSVCVGELVSVSTFVTLLVMYFLSPPGSQRSSLRSGVPISEEPIGRALSCLWGCQQLPAWATWGQESRDLAYCSLPAVPGLRPLLWPMLEAAVLFQVEGLTAWQPAWAAVGVLAPCQHQAFGVVKLYRHGAPPHYCCKQAGNQGQGLAAMLARAGVEWGLKGWVGELWGWSCCGPESPGHSPCQSWLGQQMWGSQHLWGGSELPWSEVNSQKAGL